VSVIGVVGFLAPFLGCTLVARYGLAWSSDASWLGGIALSTTSMAVVYAVMLETGFNRADFGKGILGACFVNDLGPVLVLGFLFAPFTWRTVVFAGVSLLAFALLPVVTPRLRWYYTLMMSTGLTFGTISALFGLTHGIVSQGQYSHLVAVVIGSAVIPTMIANAVFLPRHLLPEATAADLGAVRPLVTPVAVGIIDELLEEG